MIVIIDGDETVKRASKRFNERPMPQNAGDDACANTRRPLPSVPREAMWRWSLRWRARQRAMTDGEEIVAGPMGREVKPEADRKSTRLNSSH